jgi:hypothetical protein
MMGLCLSADPHSPTPLQDGKQVTKCKIHKVPSPLESGTMIEIGGMAAEIDRPMDAEEFRWVGWAGGPRGWLMMPATMMIIIIVVIIGCCCCCCCCC